MTPNREKKRVNTIFAVWEWSDRDPDLEIYQIGGLHYDPLGKKREGKPDPKIMCDHYAQQRVYAAVNRLVNAERGYSEAVHVLMDFASVGKHLALHDPDRFLELMNEVNAKKVPV